MATRFPGDSSEWSIGPCWAARACNSVCQTSGRSDGSTGSTLPPGSTAAACGGTEAAGGLELINDANDCDGPLHTLPGRGRSSSWSSVAVAAVDSGEPVSGGLAGETDLTGGAGASFFFCAAAEGDTRRTTPADAPP